jgi:Type IV secretion-system coupling protein DNA-binding domain
MSDALIPYQDVTPEVRETPEEILSKALSTWESRGRGWSLADFPVELEPPLLPLYRLINPPQPPVFDDGKRHTFLSSLFNGKVADNSAAFASYRQELSDYQSMVAEASEPPFCQYYNAEFVELQIVLPKDLKLSKGTAENLILSFAHLSHPVSFEIIGNSREIVIQFACAECDASQVKQQLEAHLPSCFIRETADYLSDSWINGDSETLIVDFGLSNDFFYPLKITAPFDADYLITAIGALSNLEADEIGILQILFQKTKNDWGTEITESVGYLEELRSPLFAVCVRVAGKSFNEDRAWQIVKGLGAGLVSFSNPSGNELIPLSNNGYEEEYHEQALLNRQSFRSGMLLNLEELALMVHLPSPLVRSDKLSRELEQTKAAPHLALNHPLILGDNHHQGETKAVSLSNDQRTKHIHLIGSSGSGKSSLLLNLIKQDLENNQGLCVIDPHGDLIDEVIANIPDSRLNDVILFDPSDAEFPIGFNILSANSELEKTLLSSDLVATFRRMSTSWGDVMDSVLANAILAFVESTRGGTLFDLKRFLVEKDFRNEFLKSVNDEGIKYFWHHEFPLITGKPQSSILIRLDTFLRQKLIRNIVCQKENKLNFRQVMDNRKVLLIKLSQGAIGEENSYLLGTLLVSKLYQTALSRQDTQTRPFFSCYLDEFHHFITPSMESVLSGVRKYNLGLVLAHQEFRQLQSRNQEVASSVLSNCYTRICFRLGDTDAEKFASGFSFFDAKALQNLSVGEAIGRIERAEFDFNLKTNLLPKVPKEIAEKLRLAVVHHSREKFGTAKNEVEAHLFSGQTNPIISAEVTASGELSKSRDQQPKVKTEVEKQAFQPDTATDQGHRYLQSIIKRIGENHGFVATLEKQVFGGIGKIDVALESDSQKIACEIAVTNTVDYELQNIQKCMASGFAKVVVISSDAKHLANIRKKAELLISTEQFSKVHFLEPENFHLFMESLKIKSNIPIIDETTHSEIKIKGYKVNLNTGQK